MGGPNGMSVGGLASGMDTNSIIDSLVSMEQQKVAQVQKRQATAEATLSTYGKLKSQLSAFKDKAALLNTADGFSIYKSTSSDPSVADIEGTGAGLQGNFSIAVNQLASSLKVSSKSFDDSTTALNLTGTLKLSTSSSYQESNPGVKFVEVSINANDALSDIASRINSATGASATASILNVANGDTRLVLTGAETGSAGFTITDANGNSLTDAMGFTSAATGIQSTSDFSLRLAGGGPAKSTSKLSEIVSGVGKTLGQGDVITYLDKSYTVGSDNTVGDILKQMATDIGTDRANVKLDQSGRIVVTNADVSTLAMKATLADGTTQIWGSMESRKVYANVVQDGQDAFYTLNGLSLQSTSNSDQDSVEGAVVQLRKTSDAAIQVSVERDDEAIKANVQGFVDSYNQLLAMIKMNSSVTIEKTKDADGKVKNSANYGVFAGEYTVTALKNQIQSIMTATVESLNGKTKFTSLASVGITTDPKEGTLGIDNAKFQKALDLDFDGVRRLFVASGWSDNPKVVVGRWTNDTKPGTYSVNPFTGFLTNAGEDPAIAIPTLMSRSSATLASRGGNSKGLVLNAPTDAGSANVTFSRGVADQIAQLYARVTNYADGTLTTATKSTQNRISDISKQVDAQQTRVDSYKERLVKQYSAMEKSMQKVKGQSSSFMSQIGR